MAARINDDEATSAIYQGVNQDQLAKMFKMDHRTAKRKMMEARQGGVKPVNKRYGSDVYLIHEIAPYFCKPIMDPGEYIRSMDPRDLPKILTKEYWAGQRSRQEYERNAGLLWETAKVVEEVGELMKIFKMSSLLMLDATERQAELNHRQREIIRVLTHGMLEDVRSRIARRFVVPDPNGDEADGEHPTAADDEEL